MRIEVLGPVRLSTDDCSPVQVAERQLRLLLVSLVVADGEPVSAEVLIDRLWGSDLPGDPRKVLRAKLSRLRTLLDRSGPGGRDLLRHTPAGYRLGIPAEVVDAGRFTGAVERAHRMEASWDKVQVLQSGLQLWRGEPFGDLRDEIWLGPAVAELGDLRGDALESLAETLLDRGEPERVLVEVSGVLEEYSTRERLLGAVMLALYQVGRQVDALQMFESLRHRLADDLGVDPSPHLRELHGRVLRQDPGLAPKQSAEAVAPVSMNRSNVPAETAPLIGRRRESQQVGALLDDSRLLTLTGIGGVGKTRLALHLARDREAQRGVWLLDLTELTRTAEDQPVSGERIASLAVSALELPERTSTTSDLDRLSAALGSRSALLVLDNCEHVVVEAAEFVTELLREAPGLRVLATSREPLGVPEEHRYEVGTLDTEPGESEAVSEAVEFFVVRARAIDPTFQLDEETTPAVTELCRRLDGLPLALELAAGRIRGVAVADLLERLGDRLDVLRRPGGRVPRRQQTLRGMIEWSWSLLDPLEQTVLRRLAIHPGSITLDAAEAICADKPDEVNGAVRPTEIVDVLISLVDRSLVRTVSTGTGMRYGLLESIATFAAEKLDDAGEREGVARRHLDYYLGFAQEAERHLRGPRQRRWLARLEAELAQLRHAFEEAVRNPDRGSAVALAVATFWYHWISGRHGPIHDDLKRAISLPGRYDNTCAAATAFEVCFVLHTRPGEEARLVDEALSLFEGDDVARARAQWFAGATLLALGVREAGERHVDAAIPVLAEAGEEWDVAVAASQRDWFLVSNWREAPRGLPDGRDLAMVMRDLGDGYGLVQVLGVEQRAAEVRGDHVHAADAARRALSLALDAGLWGEASEFLSATAIGALRSGDVATAVEDVSRSRSLATDLAYESGSLSADLAAAMVARYEDDLEGAHVLLERWLSDGGLNATQDPSTQIERGFLAARRGDHAGAEEALRALDDLTPLTAEAPVTAGVAELAAAVSVVSGDATAAAELLGVAAAHRERVGVEPSAPTRRDLDWVHARVGEQLTPEEVAAAFDRGADLNPEVELIALLPIP